VRDWEKTSSLDVQLQTAQNELPVFFIKDLESIKNQFT